MNIAIRVIPHDQQRYPTAGDWEFDSAGDLSISVSDLGDWRYNALVAIHELIEVLKCKHDGVPQEKVDAFDMRYEKNRKEGDDSEPGDSPLAPYHLQHCLATGIERIMAVELKVCWSEYDRAVMSLP